MDEIAKICQTEGIFHLINNAYGLQCAYICKLINRACVVGRVDAIACSTDKNFMVPVGKNIRLLFSLLFQLSMENFFFTVGRYFGFYLT